MNGEIGWLPAGLPLIRWREKWTFCRWLSPRHADQRGWRLGRPDQTFVSPVAPLLCYDLPFQVDRADHISTRQYARLVDEWVSGVGLRREEYGTHSLRRTKASIIYKATGNLRAVQILLGHTKIENTVRYLGVDVEDALKLAESTEI